MLTDTKHTAKFSWTDIVQQLTTQLFLFTMEAQLKGSTAVIVSPGSRVIPRAALTILVLCRPAPQWALVKLLL